AVGRPGWCLADRSVGQPAARFLVVLHGGGAACMDLPRPAWRSLVVAGAAARAVGDGPGPLAGDAGAGPARQSEWSPGKPGGNSLDKRAGRAPCASGNGTLVGSLAG